MRKTLRKTFNRVDRGKCDIKYIGEKLQAELDLACIEITSEWEDGSKVLRMEHKGVESKEYKCHKLPGGWAVICDISLALEVCLLHHLLSEHYR